MVDSIISCVDQATFLHIDTSICGIYHSDNNFRDMQCMATLFYSPRVNQF